MLVSMEKFEFFARCVISLIFSDLILVLLSDLQTTMDSKWTMNEGMDQNTHVEGLDEWRTPRCYCRRKGWDKSTIVVPEGCTISSISSQRGERKSLIPFDFARDQSHER